MDNVKAAAASVLTDRRLLLYLLLLLALHLLGVFVLYRPVQEFDNVPHFWFGFVLAEYSSKAARAANLQSRLVAWLRGLGWRNASLRQADLLVRLAGFLLIGGLFWEWAEITFSHYLEVESDSFFAFPITLRSIDGALDVFMGIIGVAVAFLLSKAFQDKDVA